MSLVNGSIPVGATFAPAGGTARTLISLGNDLSNLKLLINDAAAFIVRKLINVTVKPATPNASSPGGYTPMRHRCNYQVPILLAGGEYHVNQLNVELIVHPETSDAQKTEMLSIGSCMINDADFTTFWTTGSTT